MRLPLSKVWRAFPEFDPFTDDQCRRAVRTAKQRHAGGMLLWGVLAAGLAVVVTAGCMAFGIWALRGMGVRRAGESHIFVLAVAIFAGLITGFLIRDGWTRGALRRYIDQARCRHCGYSLLGLGAVAGEVRCPECGERSSLAAMGLTAPELLPPEPRPTPGGAAPPTRPTGPVSPSPGPVGETWAASFLRQHPRLGTLSGDQRDRLLVRLRSSYRKERRTAIITGVLAGGLAMFMLVPFGVGLIAVIFELLRSATGVPVPIAFAWVVPCLLAPIGLYWFIQLQLRSWLQSSVVRLLHTQSCPLCGYSLLYLPAPDGLVACPECAASLPVQLTGMILTYTPPGPARTETP